MQRIFGHRDVGGGRRDRWLGLLRADANVPPGKPDIKAASPCTERCRLCRFDTVIPNRGNPATKADLQAARDRVAKIDSVAIDLVKKGHAKGSVACPDQRARLHVERERILEHQRADTS
jgi:hypothetical protein